MVNEREEGLQHDLGSRDFVTREIDGKEKADSYLMFRLCTSQSQSVDDCGQLDVQTLINHDRHLTLANKENVTRLMRGRAQPQHQRLELPAWSFIRYALHNQHLPDTRNHPLLTVCGPWSHAAI